MRKYSSKEIETIWEKTPAEFNKCRRENDLNELYEFFYKNRNVMVDSTKYLNQGIPLFSINKAGM